MAKKLTTITLSGNEYAKVATRVKEFREACPRGSIKTTPNYLEDGMVSFESYILKDKSDPSSADANGHSLGKVTNQKAYEKLETIAIGRALANLGFMASGEIASSEEMDAFNSYKDEKKTEAIQSIYDCKTTEELKAKFLSLGNLISDVDVIKAKNEVYLKLNPPEKKPKAPRKPKAAKVEEGEVPSEQLPEDLK